MTLYSGRLSEGLVARPVSAEADGRGGVRGHIGGRLTGVAFEIAAPEPHTVRGRVRYRGAAAVPFELALLESGAVLRGRVAGVDTVLRREADGVTASIGTSYHVTLAWDAGRRLLHGEAGEHWTAPGQAPVARPQGARAPRPNTPVALNIGEGGDLLLAALIAVIGLRA